LALDLVILTQSAFSFQIPKSGAVYPKVVKNIWVHDISSLGELVVGIFANLAFGGLVVRILPTSPVADLSQGFCTTRDFFFQRDEVDSSSPDWLGCPLLVVVKWQRADFWK